eukprot:COSAG02_NODE_747_length_17723_cov_49.509816_8_plen_279_part_00
MVDVAASVDQGHLLDAQAPEPLVSVDLSDHTDPAQTSTWVPTRAPRRAMHPFVVLFFSEGGAHVDATGMQSRHALPAAPNCNGSNLAYVLMSVWCISRSPILLGSTLPADAVTASLLTNKDLLYVHAYARNQTVFTSYETNTSCTEATVPACGWNNSGWTKWWADLARPTDTSILKSVAQNSVGSVETTASPPIKVVLVVNVGYGVPKTGAAHTVEKTFTGWHDLGLDVGGSKLYTARDVFSRRRLSSNTSGFVVNLSRFNATLVLISEASKGGTDAR